MPGALYPQRVLMLRRALGLSQVKLAERAKVSVREIQNLEQGSVDPRISTLSKLASVFKVPLNELVFSPGSGGGVGFELLNCLDVVPVGVRIVDRDGLVLGLNSKACDLLGVRREDCEGKVAIWDMAPTEEEALSLRKHWDYVLKSDPTPTPFFFERVGSDGIKKQVRADWEYIRNAEQFVVGFVAFLT